MNQDKLSSRCLQEDEVVNEIENNIANTQKYSLAAINQIKEFTLLHPVGSRVVLKDAWWHHFGPKTVEVEVCGFSYYPPCSVSVYYKVLDTERFWVASVEYFSQCAQIGANLTPEGPP